ncbi:histamine N-methyltransferase-like [Antennarius striatus]|uniref:histamine N-methyltransferase-like n=1 Tax=Antennarius striatus TaxID=241820 RepID=UPI0035B3928C
MAIPLQSLLSDHKRYQKSSQLYDERSSENQSMQDFINNLLPDILASTVIGKSHLNVISVGSGSGVQDLNLLSMLHLKNPVMEVHNEVVEPNPTQIHSFKDLVSQTPDLDYINFNWNSISAEEFEEQWKENKMTKKFDIIHMFQVLYFVKDPEATISFFHSLLNKNGKLLISLLPDGSSWGKLYDMCSNRLILANHVDLTIDDVKSYLDLEGLSYETYILPRQVDITQCFIEGDENGDLVLDFLVHAIHFSKSVSSELKTEFMEFLRTECCDEANGKVLYNSDFEMIVIDKLK